MKIQGVLINAKNILFVKNEAYITCGFLVNEIHIYFIGTEKPYTITTYDEKEYDKIMKQLREKLE